MQNHSAATPPLWVTSPLYRALSAFPVAGFMLTVLTDAAYVQTLNLLWLHFSEWLLLAGLVFGVLAGFVGLLDLIVHGARRSLPALLSGLAVLVLATLNSFVHTADGWTAVMPYGLALSVFTVLAMLVTGWLGRRARYV